MSERRAQLVAAARHLLESEGADAVTIRRIAAALGMQGPSVYKHVPDKAAIELALAMQVLTELTALLEEVPATFTDLSSAYRTWALAHPHLHRLINNQPLPRTQLPPGLDEGAADPLIRACDGDRDLARAAWATINGLVDLELTGQFPPDADVSAAYAAAARAYQQAASLVQVR